MPVNAVAIAALAARRLVWYFGQGKTPGQAAGHRADLSSPNAARTLRSGGGQ